MPISSNLKTIRNVIAPALADDFELRNFLARRAMAIGTPLDALRGKTRDMLIVEILKPAPAECNHWTDLTAIAQTVAILGEGMPISRELADAAKNATGIGR